MAKLKKKSGLKGLRSAKRARVAVSQENLVTVQPLLPDSDLPLLVTPTTEGVDLVNWAQENYDTVIAPELKQRGGILFRGFQVNDTDRFQQVMDATTRQDLLEYTYRSTPRSEVTGRIYTSTHYPADRSIPLHNENVYTTSWAMKIWFCCLIPAATQGETPIADSRKIYARIDPAIRERFMRDGVMYVRNYGKMLDLPWEEVFQTSDKAEVAAFCEKAGIQYEWHGEKLTTRQVCQAVANHPETGESTWCNQAHLFHVSTLPTDMRESLLAAVGGEENLPRHAFYGDGSPIGSDELDAVRAAYDAETVAFPWQKGDVLMLDNMLVAHGRRPYTGERRIVVGMAEPYSSG